MAKKKARGPAREVTRAEMKALERRANAETRTRTAIVDPVEESVAPYEAPAETRTRPGILPPRARRVATVSLTRDQEIGFIRSDMLRLTWLSLAMFAILIVLTFFLR